MSDDMPYDSKKDTRTHQNHVGSLLDTICSRLEFAAMEHDGSKLTSPEKEVFDRVTPKLKALTYGSDGYMASLEDMGPALDHHYRHNSHHPEHYPDGVDGMNLIDVVEMFCDWKAATLRHADSDLDRNITINAERFDMSPQLVSILRNTAKFLEW